MEKYYIRHDEKGRVWEISPTPDNTGDWVEVESDLDMSLPILTEYTCYRYRYTDGMVRESTYEELEQERRFMMPVENITPEQKAATVMFRALAQTDVITPADAMDNAGMFPVWAEKVDTDAVVGEYLRHEDGLYRVKQAHKIQEHYPPSVHTAALYTRIQPPNAGPEPWQSGQSYAKGVEVTHNGKIWLSIVDNNTWEPGAAGVYENIWKEVTV